MEPRLQHRVSILLALAVAPTWASHTTPNVVKESTTFPLPVVLYLLSESDENALGAAMVDVVSPFLRSSSQRAIAVSLWQESQGLVVCYQIAWEDGTLYSASIASQGLGTPCKLLESSVFTFDSDEIASIEWLGSTLLAGSRANYSDRHDEVRVPIVVVAEESTTAIFTGRLVEEFLQPLLMEYEIPITMVSLRPIEHQNVLYVTLFGGSGVPRSSVRVPHASPTDLTFQDYLQALREQQSKHVS